MDNFVSFTPLYDWDGLPFFVVYHGRLYA
jgi:hypothetical protein